MSGTLIGVAELLAALWVVVGTVWLLYKGVAYIMLALAEHGMPTDERDTSPVLACVIGLGEVVFAGIVALYLLGRF